MIIIITNCPSNMEKNPIGSVISSLSYLLGAVNFVIGSIAFLPSYCTHLSAQYVGGLCFTFGSLCFCIADSAILYILLLHNQPYYDRAVLLSGSIMFVIGSLLFIPDMEHESAGDSLFIVGSLVIVGCRLWLYQKTKFRFQTVVVVNLVVEMVAALSFVVGPVLSLLGYTLPSVVLYILGSCLFVISAISNLAVEVINQNKSRKDEQESLIE